VIVGMAKLSSSLLGLDSDGLLQSCFRVSIDSESRKR
jgi:hypothetical protein